ncbi:unnamed protein product (macronuclear) [Paramecium tetraurelia]|uniref:Uncharacterized protein n=1 Tax=Paramecium tetraurelia TaxID=5888 RepID=A0DU31_PARTE|nr:uncharacterized protein GSPATT00039774001 [Paramecium tetraurelia]CAK86548.1 unnamed protein product [Paramecium tetraurelia]|eukprot:XP_001453945.1 hypothetical protein (macronuclear) [Paramecium tetraurelia strain d4-2]
MQQFKLLAQQFRIITFKYLFQYAFNIDCIKCIFTSLFGQILTLFYIKIKYLEALFGNSFNLSTHIDGIVGHQESIESYFHEIFDKAFTAIHIFINA